MISLIEKIVLFSYRIQCDHCGYSAILRMDEGTFEDPAEHWRSIGWRIMEDGRTFCSDRCKGEFGTRVRV